MPRVFIPGAGMGSEIDLPEDELVKLRKVLRLSSGDHMAVLPNDGSLIKCELKGRVAIPLETYWPQTESPYPLTIAQSLPKGDKLEELIRACTEIGVAKFLFFKSDRTVVNWDEKKVVEKLRRYQTIAREAAEVSFRTLTPEIEWLGNLKTVLATVPDAVVLSEREGVQKRLAPMSGPTCLVVGPEGGWSGPELAMIGERGVTLGPRVLRVDHAAPAAAAILLLEQERA